MLTISNQPKVVLALHGASKDLLGERSFLARRLLLSVFILAASCILTLSRPHEAAADGLDSQTACKELITDPDPAAAGSSVEWDGGCVDGLRSGLGRLTYRKADKLTMTDAGRYFRGLRTGPWVRLSYMAAKDDIVRTISQYDSDGRVFSRVIDLQNKVDRGQYFVREGKALVERRGLDASVLRASDLLSAPRLDAPAIGYAAIGSEIVVDGKEQNGFYRVLSTRVFFDAGVRYPSGGYIPAERVILQDKELREKALKAALTGTKSPPQPYAELGKDFVDTRRIVTNFKQQPFDAIGLIQIRGYRSDSKSDIGYCTGFLVERSDLLATAAHCLKEESGKKIAKELTVLFPGKGYILDGYEQEFDAPVTATALEIGIPPIADGGSPVTDWALLRLNKSASLLGRTPLKLAPPQRYILPTGATVLTAGFPGDQPNRLVAKKCKAGFAVSEVGKRDRSGIMIATDDCAIYYGDSGAPILIWNADSKLWQVLAIVNANRSKGAKAMMSIKKSFRRITLTWSRSACGSRSTGEIVDLGMQLFIVLQIV